MQQFTILIDLTPDAKEFLGNFMAAFAGKSILPIQHIAGNPNVLEVQSVEPKPEVQATQEDLASKVSLTKIRETINAKVSENSENTSKIVALLKKHGAVNASSLLDQNYGNFFADLQKL